MNRDKDGENVSANSISGIGLRGRLFSGFASIIVVFIVSVIISLAFVWRVNKDADHLLAKGVVATQSVNDVQAAFNTSAVALQAYTVFGDVGKKKSLDTSLVKLDSVIAEADELFGNEINKDVVRKWSSLKENVTKFHTTATDIVAMVSTGKNELALDAYQNQILPLLLKIDDEFNIDSTSEAANKGILDILRASIFIDMTDIKVQVERITVVLIVFLLIAIILSMLIAAFTSRSIMNPIKYAMNIANRIASGERDMSISTSRTDEAGQLIISLGQMRDAIRDGEELKRKYAEDIMHACSSMVSTLDEVRHAVDAQSSGASEQASSINQITASITEIEKSAVQTMNKARDLGGVAERTRSSGLMGLEAIESSVIGMQSVRDKVQLIAQTILDLSRQTQQVGEITSVVNNLAQQSKMLALNASIEAAKAGDAGKGFTVVASEVKNLAEQSEQSTSQVQKILEDIKIATEKAVMVTEEGTKGVDSGLQMIEKTGDIIKSLNEVIREATIASQQIEAAVRQESAGIEQITAGMNEINMVTSSFVSSVSQTTEAMEGLASVSRKLQDSVETYKN